LNWVNGVATTIEDEDCRANIDKGYNVHCFRMEHHAIVGGFGLSVNILKLAYDIHKAWKFA
jgi:hypothetical protein